MFLVDPKLMLSPAHPIPVNTAVKSSSLAASLSTLAAVVLMTACNSTPNRAPVEQRPTSAKPVVPPATTQQVLPPAVVTETGKLLPGAENSGKPGYYTVKSGDTLMRIGLDFGQGWRDLVKWNNLEKPNQIEVGQVLRVVPPGVDAGSVSTHAVSSAKLEPRPLESRPVAAAPVAGAPGATSTISAPPSTGAMPLREGDEDLAWIWPAGGNLMAGFDDARNKGLTIGGKAGDPVVAAADGRVVYAGSGLRGYGNLVIIKHNATYLTAYAHNQALLVKEDQAVRRGQQIAEMGSSDADQVSLHFEIRKQGKPIDPAKLLPAR